MPVRLAASRAAGSCEGGETTDGDSTVSPVRAASDAPTAWRRALYSAVRSAISTHAEMVSLKSSSAPPLMSTKSARSNRPSCFQKPRFGNTCLRWDFVCRYARDRGRL